MKTSSSKLWLSSGDFFKQAMPAHLDAWLQHPRLSECLKTHFNHEIKLLGQEFSDLSKEEQSLLEVSPASQGWLREICHVGNGNNLVYARTAVPDSTYDRYANEFNSLGNHSIGETLLFHDPMVQRSELRYRIITTDDPLYPRISEILGQSKHYYARCSVFHWQAFPLLITEIYSPDEQRWQYS